MKQHPSEQSSFPVKM